MVPTTILPAPRVNIAIRPGTLDDVAFIDSLQKKQSKEVGFFPTKAIEGKVRLGHVLVAVASCELPVASKGEENPSLPNVSSLETNNWQLATTPVGYLIGNDQYFKRDDVGCIFQINVVAEYRRSLVAASLLKAQFERSAYGCKLYCCWCAQDIGANRFWESMGFVPLAFRTGSEKKSRTHIFWQKRIRAGDVTTAWWFPSQTSGGSIREDRLVLPIPPGRHWSEEMPRVVPGEQLTGEQLPVQEKKQLTGKVGRRSSVDARTSASETTGNVKKSVTLGGFHWMPPKVEKAKAEKPKREKKPKQKNDPALVAAARELRDRWLDEVNSGRTDGIALPAGKYDVAREIGHARLSSTKLLEQAA